MMTTATASGVSPDVDVMNRLREMAERKPAFPGHVPGGAPLAKASSAPATSAPAVVLKDGEALFSDVFGLKSPKKDFGVFVHSIELWDEEVRHYIPDIDTSYIFPPEETEVVVSALIRGKRSQFVHGPKGSGKSTLCEQVCARLHIPFIRVNMAEDAEGSRLFGGPTAKDGNIVWKAGPAEIAARAKYNGGIVGCVLQVDEVDSAPAGINLNMQWMLEKNGKIMLSEKPDGEVLVVPGNKFHVYCTSNTQLQGDTTGKYAGTNVQNEAFLDRMSSVVRLGYLGVDHEVGIITSKTGVGIGVARKMRALAEFIRNAYDTGHINFNISPRGLIEWGEEAEYWGSVGRGFKYTFFNKLIESDKTSVREMFAKVFGEEQAKEVA